MKTLSFFKNRFSKIHLSLITFHFSLIIAVVIFVMNFAPRVFASQFIPGEQLEAMAREEIEAELDRQGESRRRELNMQRRLPPINLPNGVINIKLHIPNINYFGNTPVKAEIAIDGKPYRDVNFLMVLKVFDSVVVASHNLRIEVPVTEADFRIEEIAIDGRTEYLQDIQTVVGLVPHRVVKTGEPVLLDYFQQPIAVKSNQPVKIIVRYKGLEVAASGITMTRGRLGEVIRVKNESSKKVLSAKVIDSNTVEVTY